MQLNHGAMTGMNAKEYTLRNIDLLAMAVETLGDTLAQPKNPTTRDATIERFESTFDLARTTLQHYLMIEAAIYAFHSKELFRQAGRQDVIANVEAWFTYLKGRNITPHTYNEKTAEDTYRLAAAFLPDAQALLDELRKRCEPLSH